MGPPLQQSYSNDDLGVVPRNLCYIYLLTTTFVVSNHEHSVPTIPMPPRVSEHAVVGLLRQCFTTPRCHGLRSTSHQSSSQTRRPAHRKISRTPASTTRQQRSFTTKTVGLRNHTRYIGQGDRTKPLLRSFSQAVGLAQGGKQEPERIAVLGGGITGLASAHYLAREKPDANITIYEGSSRLGGWLQSKQVEVEKGTVLFESGPRTLRCNSTAGMVTLELVSISDIYCVPFLTALPDYPSRPSRPDSRYPERLHFSPEPIHILS